MALGNLVRYQKPTGRVVRRDFDRLVDDLWSGFGLAPIAFAPSVHPAAQGSFVPTFDAVELENEYRVTADIPGVEPADLEVCVEDGLLTIRGQRHYEDETETEEGGVQRVSERGRFERKIRFPGEIVENDVKATQKHGVLTVTIPKPAEIKPEVRAIPVETA
jgi:HSP20 family protein